MIQLLAKLFMKKEQREDKEKERCAYGMLCSLVGIGLNIFLFAGKYLAGVISGSIAIMADAFNNLSDAGSSLITLIGFKFAGMKADAEHPFGHGRFEYISGFVVAGAIILMGFELARTSVLKIFSPSLVETGFLSMGILVVSICVKLYMCFYNSKIGKRIDSAAMRATAADSMSDAAATSVVLISMLVTRYAGINIDGICGLLVAGFILWTGYNAAKETLSPLLGEPPAKELIEQIKQIVMSHPEIVGIHDLIVHDYGPGRFMISLHGEVPGDGDIFELHDVIDQAEKELKQKLGCEAVIHMDPIVTNDHEISEIKEEVAELIQKMDPSFSMHDFRMVKGTTHTNLIFDVVIPFGSGVSDQEVTEKIQKMVLERRDNYYTVIHVDHISML